MRNLVHAQLTSTSAFELTKSIIMQGAYSLSLDIYKVAFFSSSNLLVLWRHLKV